MSSVGQPQHPIVVVGVDGSEPSLRALGWAADHAHLMTADLEVVTAWTFPEEPAPLGLEIRVPFQEELMEEADRKLAEIIANALPEDCDLLPAQKVVRGNATRVLLAEAEHATLLVVGKLGHGSFDKVLWGSVSERCVRRAHCPVVVVP